MLSLKTIAPVVRPTKASLSVSVTLGITANLLFGAPASPKSTAPLGLNVPTPIDAPFPTRAPATPPTDRVPENTPVVIPADVGLKTGDATVSNE